MRAHYFGVIFDEVPTFSEIKDGTAEIEKIPGFNELFKLAPRKFHWCSIKDDYRTLVGLKGVNVVDKSTDSDAGVDDE